MYNWLSNHLISTNRKGLIPMMPNDEILTIPEVAKYLKLSRSKTYSLVQQGVIPHFKVERNVRVRWDDLRKWVDEQVETSAN